MGTAAIGAGASLLGGITSGKGASAAAKTQAASYQAGLNQQQAQFNQTQQNLSPFIQAGSSALGAEGNLLGLNGDGAQGSAIASLQNSPLFQSQYGTGVDTVLQNAAATGGVRGGNVNNSLAQFGSGLLSNVIQNQLGNLQGVIGTGAGAATGLGSFGQANSSALASLLKGQGTANGIAAGAPAFSFGSALQGLSSSGALQRLFGGGSASMFTLGNGGGGSGINYAALNADTAPLASRPF